MSKPDLGAFAKRAKPPKPATSNTASATRPSTELKHLQVRMFRNDAVRLRRAAEDRGQTVQAALLEAVNLYLRNAGEPPASDPGTNA